MCTRSKHSRVFTVKAQGPEEVGKQSGKGMACAKALGQGAGSLPGAESQPGWR